MMAAMFIKLPLFNALAAAAALLATACGSDSNSTPATSTGQGIDATAPATSAPSSATSASGTQASATRQATPAPATPATAAATVSGPLTLTPSQTEGPYYPPTKPADRDNDLTLVSGQSGTAAGTALLLGGTLVRQDGTPIAGATVEIWQVDENGIYLHPQQPEASRDKNFQSYGESVTDAAGNWSFRTINPPAYEGRPKHIHVKVRIDGREVLTTQIYFEGDPLLANDGVSRGSDISLMTIKPEASMDSGKQVEKATWRIVIA
jgi:protocatechuate 3,4-dioxygenase, beta subunit